jgi:hypothetical protein
MRRSPHAGEERVGEELHTPEPGKLRGDPQGRHLMTYAEPGRLMSLYSQTDDVSSEDREVENMSLMLMEHILPLFGVAKVRMNSKSHEARGNP